MSDLFAVPRSWAISKYLCTINPHRTLIGNHVQIEDMQHTADHTAVILNASDFELAHNADSNGLRGIRSVAETIFFHSIFSKKEKSLCVVKVFYHRQMHQITCISPFSTRICGTFQPIRIGQSRIYGVTVVVRIASRQPTSSQNAVDEWSYHGQLYSTIEFNKLVITLMLSLEAHGTERAKTRHELSV